MAATRIPAVILGLGHPRQTAYAKSLARFGVAVHALHNEPSVYVSSRHLTRFHHIDSDPERQLRYVEDLGRKLGRALLVPTNDDYVALVSKNLERLSKHFIVPLPGWDIVGAIFDRATCYARAASLGIGIPRYWSPQTDAGLQRVVSALEPEKSDYIIKTPSILSAPANETAVRLTKAAPKLRSDILLACEDLKQRTGEYPMIQEVVPGAADSAIGVTLLVSPKGEIVMAYCVRRLRLASYKIDAGYVHPYELGSVVWCETTHDDEALDAARELVRAFGYTGQITIEFRRDSRNGALYLMKVEPRPVRATSLATAIGMDIPTDPVQGLHGGAGERAGRISGWNRLAVDHGLRAIAGLQHPPQPARHIARDARQPPDQGVRRGFYRSRTADPLGAWPIGTAGAGGHPKSVRDKSRRQNVALMAHRTATVT